MQNSENLKIENSTVLFVDYKPAELNCGKDWIIVYYAKNPVTNKLERIRLRVPVVKSKIKRLKHAKIIVASINMKLANGWSPFLESKAKNYKTFEACIQVFLTSIKKQLKDEVVLLPKSFFTELSAKIGVPVNPNTWMFLKTF